MPAPTIQTLFLFEGHSSELTGTKLYKYLYVLDPADSIRLEHKSKCVFKIILNLICTRCFGDLFDEGISFDDSFTHDFTSLVCDIMTDKQ